MHRLHIQRHDDKRVGLEGRYRTQSIFKTVVDIYRPAEICGTEVSAGYLVAVMHGQKVDKCIVRSEYGAAAGCVDRCDKVCMREHNALARSGRSRCEEQRGHLRHISGAVIIKKAAVSLLHRLVSERKKLGIRENDRISRGRAAVGSIRALCGSYRDEVTYLRHLLCERGQHVVKLLCIEYSLRAAQIGKARDLCVSEITVERNDNAASADRSDICRHILRAALADNGDCPAHKPYAAHTLAETIKVSAIVVIGKTITRLSSLIYIQYLIAVQLGACFHKVAQALYLLRLVAPNAQCSNGYFTIHLLCFLCSASA